MNLSTLQLPVSHMVEAGDWLTALTDGDADDFMIELMETDENAFDRIFPSWYAEVCWADTTTDNDPNTRWERVWWACDTVASEIAEIYGYAWDGTDRSYAELIMKTHVVDHLDRKGAWYVLVQRNNETPVTVWGQTTAEWAARRPRRTSTDLLAAEITGVRAQVDGLLELLDAR